MLYENNFVKILLLLSLMSHLPHYLPCLTNTMMSEKLKQNFSVCQCLSEGLPRLTFFPKILFSIDFLWFIFEKHMKETDFLILSIPSTVLVHTHSYSPFLKNVALVADSSYHAANMFPSMSYWFFSTRNSELCHTNNHSKFKSI